VSIKEAETLMVRVLHWAPIANELGAHICTIHGFGRLVLADKMQAGGADPNRPAGVVLWLQNFHANLQGWPGCQDRK